MAPSSTCVLVLAALAASLAWTAPALAQRTQVVNHASCSAPMDTAPIGPLRVLSVDQFRTYALQSQSMLRDRTHISLEYARVLAALTHTLEQQPSVYTRIWSLPRVNVAYRLDLGSTLASLGYFDSAIPHLACGAFTQGGLEQYEASYVRAVAASRYFEVMGTSRRALRRDEVASVFANFERAWPMAQRLQADLAIIAAEQGALSDAYQATELLAGAMALVAPVQHAMAALRNANARRPDTRISLYLEHMSARLAGPAIVPLAPEDGRLQAGNLTVFNRWNDFEGRNSSKFIYLGGEGDVSTANAHALGVARAYAARSARDTASIRAAAREYAWTTPAIPSLLDGERQWTQAANDSSVANAMQPQRLSRADREIINADDPHQVTVLTEAITNFADADAAMGHPLIAATARMDGLFTAPALRYEIAVSRLSVLVDGDASREDLERGFLALRQEDFGPMRREADWLASLGPAIVERREGRLVAASAALSGLRVAYRGPQPAVRRLTAPLVTLDEDAAIERGQRNATPEAILRSSYAEALLDCTTLRSTWTRTAGLNPDTPALEQSLVGYGTRTALCGREDDLRRAFARNEMGSAARIAEHMAVMSGRWRSFPKWRRALLYDLAALAASRNNDQAGAQRYARLSLSERSGDTHDPLTRGTAPLAQAGLYRLRLSSIALLWPNASAQERTSLASEALGLIERFPRTSAAAALSGLGVQLSSLRAGAVANYVEAWEAARRARAAANMAPAAESGAAADRARAAQTRADQALAALRTQDPVAAAALTRAAPPSIDQVRRGLARNEAVVIYFTPPAQSGLAIVVRADRAELVTLPATRGQFQPHLDALRANLATDAAADRFPASAAYELYRALLAPIEPHLSGVETLSIVPDAALDALAWPALLTRAPANATMRASDFAAAPWLIDRFALRVSPSASAFAALRGARARASAQDFLGISFSGAGAGRQALSSDSLHILGALLGAARNVSGDDVNEAEIRRTLNGARGIIGFAAHGIMAGEISGLSEPALLVASNSGAAPASDGFLTSSEIAVLRLDASLVLLLACNSASGSGEPGAETLSGLVRAFFLAGARNVIATNWVAADGAVIELATPLAGRLASGETIAEALAGAQRDMRAARGGALAHPHYWATFGLFGAS